jgi:ABC-type sugar transport system substrate-binding protein
MRRWIAAGLGVVLSLAGPAAWAAAFNVVFINPGRSDEPFWRSTTRFAQPAAQQLGIKLEVLYAERDHLKMIELTRQVTSRAKKPDYLMLVNEKLAAGEMLKIANTAGVKSLLVYSSLVESQQTEYGKPRTQLRHWLGSVTANATEAGKLTAEELIRQTQQMRVIADDGKVHVAAIAGDKATPAGVQRLQGAVDVFAAHPSVVLEQVVYGNWERVRANEQAAALLLRYPKINAFWAASDLMAFGAIDAAEAAGRTPGSDLLISAINNSPAVLNARVQGRVSALAGGHFTLAAWGLVMLYDYHHGKDFARDGTDVVLPLFTLMDEERAQRFLSRFGDEDFSGIDFRQFSRHLNPQLRSYQFSLLPALK